MGNNSRPSETKFLNFSVDAHLLRELGERLVGRPHIALAELLKNSYDADATRVDVIMSDGSIVIEDNGNGMTLQEFTRFWMRIGTAHKQREALSPRFKRSLTGSKGVGRLAVQFLARKLDIVTTGRDQGQRLSAHVNWDEAVTAKELTEATVAYELAPEREVFAGAAHGTRITLTRLNDIWDEEALTRLAHEIWTLQPPYDSGEASKFQISLATEDPRIEKAFARRMSSNLDLWSARIDGTLLPPHPDDPPRTRRFGVALRFRGGRAIRHSFTMANCVLTGASYDIRIFSLHGRQRYGIKVDEAREYLLKYGGVHIYDAGFHLPYYGPENDWLNIEKDHSHRKSHSDLLPDALQVVEGLNNLPTQSRIYGVVKVDTAYERRVAEESGQAESSTVLQIQVSRDRLVENQALENLRRFVRTGLDFYAVRETLRRLEETQHIVKATPPDATLKSAEEVINRYRDELPKPLRDTLKATIQTAVRAETASRELAAQEIGLVSSLATAGMSALAYEHEYQKQFLELDRLTRELETLDLRADNAIEKVEQLALALRSWLKHAQETRALFNAFSDEDNRTARYALKARQVLEQVVAQTRVLTRGATIKIEAVPDTLRLPAGTFTEWSAILQNILVNATNAMLDCDRREIRISSSQGPTRRCLIVEDTGRGVNLQGSEELFKPFIRKSAISPARRSLGMGGSGLGLAIVRMIASSLNCATRFRRPGSGYSTAFELCWESE